jgi:hypothetical protein
MYTVVQAGPDFQPDGAGPLSMPLSRRENPESTKFSTYLRQTFRKWSISFAESQIRAGCHWQKFFQITTVL